MHSLVRWQENALKALAGRADDYCLGGGTALSRAYFHHRQSFDLDFFSLEFNRKKILALIEFLSGALKKKFKLIREQTNKDKVRIMIFSAALDKTKSLKIDFIEDYIKRLKPAKQVDGVWVFALEDIYLRKVYAITGTAEAVDLTGRRVGIGGRQEARDFFDLYFLSHTFMNLSNFAFKYCGIAMQEALIRWFRTYSRMDIKAGLLELKTKNKFDYREMESHFKREIGRLLEKQIGRL